ncbi:nuclear transport factor 2 family protein [Sphingomonas sp. SRS2]|uniref:nuclear transport factor 2 family protein n=1 Tax=Sphingomonas sp. SRS2 TaxID=133190 RepID=UPI00061842E9|nr:nuclear transport factor 2 family protein [Sphingomonas sp. SRS2]KKC25190.1 hypothetical protein WP12_15005 [Sphingomonas sp. SRS2]
MNNVDRLQRLEAVEDIKHLKARYFRWVDTQQWQELRTLFVDDAILLFPETDPEPMPIGQFMRAVEAAFTGGVSIHHGHMAEIEILSLNTAQAIWAMEDRIYFPPGVPGIRGASEIHGAGHYHETYIRRDGIWLFKSMKLTRLRLEVKLAPVTVI